MASKKIIQGDLELDVENVALIVWYYVESMVLDPVSGVEKVCYLMNNRR